MIMKDNIHNIAHITIAVGKIGYRGVYIRLDRNKQIATANGERINIDINAFIEKLFNIIENWPREWIPNDSPERPYYAIHIRKTNGKTQLYQGTDKFRQFQQLLELLKQNNIFTMEIEE